MNVYIWNNPYPVSYGSSCLFAIAESEEAARKMVADKLEYGTSSGMMDLANLKLGAPDIVSTLPAAYIYHWSE